MTIALPVEVLREIHLHGEQAYPGAGLLSMRPAITGRSDASLDW
jgi:hypothetical protein